MNVPEYFGSLVFDDRAMKERLSRDKHLGRPLSLLFTAAHFLFYLGKETI